MDHTIFHLKHKEDVRAHLADQSARDPETEALGLGHTPMEDPATDACGGMGVYMRPTDYIKVLANILRDDGKLLKSASIEEMFTPQLSEGSKAIYNFYAGAVRALGANLNKEIEKDYGLGAMLIMQETETGVKKGSLQWGGYPNLYWVRHRSSTI